MFKRSLSRFVTPALAAGLLTLAPTWCMAQPRGSPAPVGAPGAGGNMGISPGQPGTGQPMLPSNLPSVTGLTNTLPTGGNFGTSQPAMIGPFGFFPTFGFPKGLGLGGLGLGGLGNLSMTAVGQNFGFGFGTGVTNAVLWQLYTYQLMRANGYLTGRPVLTPGAGMMANIQGSPVTPPGTAAAAVLRINAPKDAKVSLNGTALKWNPQQGWVYQSPVMGPYDLQNIAVRVTTGENNYETTRDAQVILRPGDQKSVTIISDVR